MILRSLLLATAALSLVACKPAEPVEQEIPPEPAPAAPKVIPVTSEGFGPLKIGMTESDADQAIGGFLDGEPSAECHERAVKDGDLGLVVMFEEGKVSRLYIRPGSPLSTDVALHVGDPEVKVRAAYAGYTEEPHKYEPAPAKRLIHWDKPDQRGMTYEIGQDGKVKSISAGGPSILYVEGCG